MIWEIFSRAAHMCDHRSPPCCLSHVYHLLYNTVIGIEGKQQGGNIMAVQRKYLVFFQQNSINCNSAGGLFSVFMQWLTLTDTKKSYSKHINTNTSICRRLPPEVMIIYTSLSFIRSFSFVHLGKKGKTFVCFPDGSFPFPLLPTFVKSLLLTVVFMCGVSHTPR